MMDFLIGLFMGYKAKERTNNNSYTPTSSDNTPKYHTSIYYEYWPAFDNDIPTLEMAYKLYDENNICHINDHGTIKCYMEFIDTETVDKEYLDKGYVEII